jgi:ketosteroid isomerase-like protein
MSDPTAVEALHEGALQLAAQALVMELFARIDRRDIDGAVGLYAEDAVFLGATGRTEIEQAMRAGLAPNAEHRSRHVIANVRSSMLDGDSVLVDYTALAFTLQGPGPFAARSILDQQQVIRRSHSGKLEIAEQRIPGLGSQA